MSTLDQTTFPFNLSSFTYLYNNTIRLVINLILHIIQNQTVIFKNFIFLTSIGSYWQEIELQLGHGCHVENVRRELCVQHHRSATSRSTTQRLGILNVPLLSIKDRSMGRVRTQAVGTHCPLVDIAGSA